MAWYSKVKASEIYAGKLYSYSNRTKGDGGLLDVRGEPLSATYGAGLVGTSDFTPRTYRWTENGVIITEYQIDITGLKCKGDAANDVIALTGAGYIDRVVTATHGVIFRAEMSCLEVPGEGTATITTDIDITYDTLATLEYDGAGDGAALASGGNWTAGRTIVTEDCGTGFAANNYLYIGEGSTDATTGVYNAGMFLIRLYGHAVLA